MADEKIPPRKYQTGEKMRGTKEQPKTHKHETDPKNKNQKERKQQHASLLAGVRAAHLAEPEVCDLDVLDAVPAEDILRLEVAVHDAHLVEVRNALHQAVHHSERLARTQEERSDEGRWLTRSLHT